MPFEIPLEHKQYFCKARFQVKSWGLAYGWFVRKLNTQQNIGFLKVPKTCILENPRKNSMSSKPDFKKIVGVGQGLSEN